MEGQAKSSWFGTATETGFRRSEEHTPELQSRPQLVCRLLLEKKKIISCNAGAPFRMLSNTNRQRTISQLASRHGTSMSSPTTPPTLLADSSSPRPVQLASTASAP